MFSRFPGSALLATASSTFGWLLFKVSLAYRICQEIVVKHS